MNSISTGSDSLLSSTVDSFFIWMFVFLPGGRDEGLGSHEEEEHDEGADQVGVEHFISHLEKLDGSEKTSKRSQHHFALWAYKHTYIIAMQLPASTPPYLVLYVCVLEHQRQRSDVLLVHALTAPNLDGMFDAFVNLLGGGLPYVGHRAVCKGGQDLQGMWMVGDQSAQCEGQIFYYLMHKTIHRKISFLIAALNVHYSCQWRSQKSYLHARFDSFYGLWWARRARLCSFRLEGR